MNKKYMPSNGTEVIAFIETYCTNCLHCDPDPDGTKRCDILRRTLCYSVGDERYPSEWTYDEAGEPTCTSWRKWDWGNDGNPDDPDNPKAPVPDNPNQLCMPFIFDEIGVPNTCKPALQEKEVGA